MARSLQLLLALVACCSAAASSASSLRRAPLSTWRFRSLNGSISIANATTPGTSHTHLLAGGVIAEDPYRRFNEIDMQWIAHTTWVYETPLPAAVAGDARIVFETLDGVAHVSLNGESLGAPAVNAFRPQTFALPAKLIRNETGVNILQVVFMSPLEYMQQAAAAYPYEVPATRNFNVWAEPSHRPFLRKAGSDFGWDWGPAYATSGIAGPAFVEWISSAEETTDVSVVARLDDINVVYEFPAFNDFSSVTGHVTLDVQSMPSLRRVTLRLSLNGERHGDDITVDLADAVATASLTVATEASLPFAIPNPTLWWPSSHGDPHLYEVRVDAFGDDGATPLATLSHRIGFRSIELVQQPTQAGGVPGETFFFRINGVPIFMKGANWIPNDSFPTRVTSDKVAFLLQSAVASHMNMVRVWGGGRYESDFFYETCDRLGLLVWHEFMFACAMYPRDRGFLDEVRAEVEFQTRRLRKFTSLAIWGGNNENENMMEAFAAGDFMPSDKPPFNRDVAVTDFTAIFVDTLRPIVLKLDPTSRPFVDTSPSNGLLSQDPYVKRWGRSTNAIAFGDVHYYNYSGDCQDPRMYPHARFVSEFGFQSMPSLVGLQDVSAPEDWSSFQAFWRLLKFRERHENGTAQMATQIARRFHVPFPFLDESWLATPLDGDFELNVTTRVGAYLYLTQIQQGLCYQTAIEAWRRSRNPVHGGGTMGILYWQLNDVWQGTSWSSIEFDGRWKSLQYAVQRAYAPVLLSVVQTTDHELTVVGINDLKDKDLAIRLVYEVVATDTGDVVHSFQAAARAALPRLSSELLDTVTVSSLLTEPCDATHCFLRLRCDAGDPAIACGDAFFFFAPFKHLALGHGRVAVTSVTSSRVADGGNHTAFDVALQTDGFVALFVEVEAPRVRGLWDRNSFHVVGNATQTLRFVTRENVTRDVFQQQLQLRWLQQTYETEAAVSVA